MKVRIYVIDKNEHKVLFDNKECDFVEGDDLCLEPADIAASRIIQDNLGFTPNPFELRLVRRESSTIINHGKCEVYNLATYIYRYDFDNDSLNESRFNWRTFDEVFKVIVNKNKYIELGQFTEALNAV